MKLPIGELNSGQFQNLLILAGKIETRDKVTVAVLSGGNVDPQLFAGIQAGA